MARFALSRLSLYNGCEMEIADTIAAQRIGLREKKRERKRKRILARYSHNGLIGDVSAELEKGGLNSPAQLLAAVTAGHDIRGGERTLLDAIREIQDRGPDELPTLDEWIDITQTVIDSERYRHALLPIESSIKAAETLSRYLYATKENVQNTNLEVSTKKLSKKEIRKFLKAFNEEF